MFKKYIIISQSNKLEDNRKLDFLKMNDRIVEDNHYPAPNFLPKTKT